MWRSIFFASVLGLGACDARSTSSHLVTLEALDVVEEESIPALNLHGSGFPVGRPCQLEARGTLYAKARTPVRIRQMLACRALSENVASAPLDAWLKGVDGTPIFEGEFRIEFSDDDRRVRLQSAQLQTRLRLEDPNTHDAAAALAFAQSARTFQRELGLPDIEAQARGVVVTRVTEQSPAAKAGLSPGDNIVRINGAPVELPEDLQRPAHTTSVQLSVARTGQRELMLFDLSRGTAQSSQTSQASIFFLALGALAVFLLPGPRARFVQRTRTSFAEGHSILLSGLLIGLSALCSHAMDVRILWGIPVAIHLAALAWTYRKQSSNLSNALHGVVDIGAATLGVAALGLARGSLHLPTVELGLVPLFDFDVFANPAVWLGCAALLWSPKQHTARSLAFHTSKLLGAGRLACVLGFATAPMSLRMFLCVALVGALLAYLPKPKLTRLSHAALALLAPAWALLLVSFDAPRLPQGLCALIAGGLLAWGARCLHAKTFGVPEPQLDPALSPFV